MDDDLAAANALKGRLRNVEPYQEGFVLPATLSGQFPPAIPAAHPLHFGQSQARHLSASCSLMEYTPVPPTRQAVGMASCGSTGGSTSLGASAVTSPPPIPPPPPPPLPDNLQATAPASKQGQPRRRGGKRQKGRQAAALAAATSAEAPALAAAKASLAPGAGSTLVVHHAQASSQGLIGVGSSSAAMASGGALVAAAAGPHRCGGVAATDSPAYVTEAASLFVVRNTFLELGATSSAAVGGLDAAGAPLRPIRSAAGRLDYMGAAGSSSLAEDGGHADIPAASSSSSAPPGGVGAPDAAQAASILDASAGPPAWHHAVGMQQGTASAQADDAPDAAASPMPSMFALDQDENGWQVKNTFLTLSPQVKPIRAVRTADCALCTLGDSE